MMVEYAVLAHLRGFLGWLDGDGIFAPGISSISHMYNSTFLINLRGYVRW